MAFLYLLTVWLLIGVSKCTSFTGYRVFSLNVQTESQAEVLSSLDGIEHVIFWRDISLTRSTDVMVSGEYGQQFLDLLEEHGINYDIMMHDVQKVLNEQQIETVTGEESAMDWDQYHPLKEIYDWLRNLRSTRYITVRNEVIAHTYEKRDVRVIVVTGSEGDPSKKQNIWIDSGIHGSEWISPAVVTYMINELVNPSNQEANKDLLEKYVWHFLPVQNPDGYAYTWTNMTDPKTRFWRKNRLEIDDGFECIGVDLNRNFGFNWNLPGGSSNWSCSNYYRGLRAWSEPETYESTIYIMAHNPIISLNFHSYGQVWATPWAYSSERPPNNEKLLEGAKIASSALNNVHGVQFECKTLHEMMGKPTAGSSVDFIHYAGRRTNYAYGVELRDRGSHGLLLPSDQIKPSGQETWVAVKALARHVTEKGRLPKVPPPK